METGLKKPSFIRTVGFGALYGIGSILILSVLGYLFGEPPKDAANSSVLVPLIILLVVGAFNGAIIGTIVGVIRLSVFRWRHPVATARPFPPRPLVPPRPFHSPMPLEPQDTWFRMRQACEMSVQRAQLAAEMVPPSPAKEWLMQIIGTMRAELDTARSLAETGRRLYPTNQPRLTEQPIYRQLHAAVDEFAATERRIAEVVNELSERPDLSQVDNQLRLLEQQLPHLRQADD